MKSCVLSTLSVVLFVVGVSAQITINTPATAVECSPVQLSWTGGATPVTISSHDGANPYGAPIDTYTNITTNPFQTPNPITLPGVGRTIGWTITDKNGLQGITAPVTIQPGGTCAGSASAGASSSAAPSDSSASGSTPASVASTPVSTPAASSRAGSGSTSSSPGASGSRAPAAASSASSTSTSRPANAAMPAGVPYGAAGILGAVIAAVFA